jgi:hypothetical protein
VQLVIIFNHKTTFNINKLDDNNITGVDNQSGTFLQLLVNSEFSPQEFITLSFVTRMESSPKQPIADAIALYVRVIIYANDVYSI